MKKNLGEALKSSLVNERAIIANKQTSLAERLEKAETIFEDNPREKIRLHRERIGQGVKKDTFTFPQADYELIDKLKNKALKCKINLNKSEIIRAGLIYLHKLDEKEYILAIECISKVKQGRPKED